MSESEIDQLSVPERLELIALLWDSIPDSVDDLEVPGWHRQELQRRLTTDACSQPAIAWEQLRTRLRRNS